VEIKPDITISKEWFINLMPELAPLFYDEWQEVSNGEEHRQELNPAWDKYIQIEMAGMLHLFTARDAGKLVGYLLVVVHPHLHFADSIYGFVDAFYVLPPYRDTEIPADLVAETEKVMSDAGIARIQFAVSPDLWLYKVIKKLHYIRTEFNFMKWL